jgi:ERCC4-type nuclease
MKRLLSGKELDELLKTLTVICDTREQVNSNVTEYFASKKIPYESRKLDIGDYSAKIGIDTTLECDVVGERKANIDELCGNMTADRDRFEREFLRAKAYGVKVYLIIENCSWSDIMLHNYRSKLTPKSLMATLLSWQVRFNVSVIFCKPQETGQIIYYTLYYAAREALK